MREHVGRPVKTWQVAEILNAAYRKAASVQNAVSGSNRRHWVVQSRKPCPLLDLFVFFLLYLKKNHHWFSYG